MPHFDSQAPDDLGRSGYRLIRTPAGHPLVAHVISDNLVGCNTHFVGNRTIPCEPPHCDACESGIAWRWHGYLAILIDATSEIAIFEVTARASKAFSDYYKRHGTTRGAHFKAVRLNARPNGRVLVQVKPADLQKIALPPVLPVEKLLCHIWNIPENQVSKTNKTNRKPFQTTVIDRENPELTPEHHAAKRFDTKLEDLAPVAPNKNGDQDP